MPKSKILSEPDRRAVDLLLNHAATISMASRCEPLSPQRIDAVRKVLARLDKMPPVDPPFGLVQRTMDRVGRVPADPTCVTTMFAGKHFQ